MDSPPSGATLKVHQAYDAAAGRWQAYAYVTTDGSTNGLFVIDLTDLPQRISKLNYASDFSAAHNVFAANTDYATGLPLTDAESTLIIAGSNNGSGRYRAYSLDDPASPGFIEMPGNAEYMHDAASMIITDSRKDTQCANGSTYCEVLFDFNESSVDIWDVTQATSPVLLSRTGYPNSGYTHSGWPTEDKRFLFVHDELDEQRFQLGTTVRTLSLTDLRAPQLSSTWTAASPIRAIDHNGFVRGNRLLHVELHARAHDPGYQQSRVARPRWLFRYEHVQRRQCQLRGCLGGLPVPAQREYCCR